MGKIRLAGAFAALIALSSCAQISAGVSTVCGDIAKIPPPAAAVLDAQDPHSAVGVLWADTKAACVAGVPAPGIDQGWGGMVIGELKALIPQILPTLIPLLIGFL